MRLAKVLKAYRETEGLTLRELADEIGVPLGTLVGFEAGKQVPGGLNLLKLLNWLIQDKQLRCEGCGDRIDAPDTRHLERDLCAGCCEELLSLEVSQC